MRLRGTGVRGHHRKPQLNRNQLSRGRGFRLKKETLRGISKAIENTAQFEDYRESIDHDNNA